MKITSKKVIEEKILKILIDSEIPLTVNDLAKGVGKSGKTVRNYLNQIQNDLKKKNIDLVKKPNVGVYIDLDDKGKKKLKSELFLDEVIYKNYSPEYRRNYILRTLFENQFSYTIQLFADELYCSTGTISNDLIFVQKWIEGRGLALVRKQNQGLWIEGTEKDYRCAMMDLIQEKGLININEELEERENLDYRIDFINYKKIKHFIPNIELLKIQSVIQTAESKLGYYFTDQAFINLITHIAIAISRVKNKHQILVEKEFFKGLKDKYEFEISKWLLNELSEEFNVEFPESEIAYINLHMMGAKIQQDENIGIAELFPNIEDAIYIEIASEIIGLVGSILNVNFSSDEILFNSLVLHLRPTIIRLKNGLRLRNPIIDKVKNEITSIFGATWACSSIFEKHLGILINEDEIGYIAIHIASAYERIKNKLKVIVVCSSGVGTSQLLKTKLKNRFNELNISHCIPYHYLNEKLINESDLIISTIPNIKNIPKVVNVSTLLTDYDVLKIKNKIKHVSKNNMKKLCQEVVIKDDKLPENCEQIDIFDENFIFLDEEMNKFEDIIYKYGKIMVDNGYAKEGFSENIIKREAIESTVIGSGVAIPHSIEEFVKMSKICIVRPKEAIEWKGSQLNLILILCLKFGVINTTRRFFKNFYSILSNEDLIEKIIKSKNKYEIIEIFKNGGV
ncbi:BglG family transcription antiterminator [Clostridium sediminicola]|uniref:BglG family transcription antiterminator n=1 Tax=Clostridium sediminicola TaxID=3114879 RepID=UPI0031F207DC